MVDKNAINKYKKLYEYNFYTSRESTLTEDDEEDGMKASPNNDVDVETDGAPMSELPQSGIPPQDASADMGGDMSVGDGMDVEGDVDVDGPDMGMGDDMDIDGPDMGFDEIEVDVSELTDKQEELRAEMSKNMTFFSEKFDDITNLIDSLNDKLTTSIDASRNEIDSIRQEIVKRNPTNTEKLKLRSLDSYPYNVPIDEYWEDRRNTGNYDVNDSENESEKEYILTQSDVDGTFNDYDILKTIDEVKNFKLSEIF